MKQHSELLGVESAEMWNPAFGWCKYLRECFFPPHAFALVHINTDYDLKKHGDACSPLLVHD